jgi:hypothetical protein
MSGVESVEALSATTISTSPWSWASNDDKAWAM